MNKLIDLCINAMSEIYTIVVTKRADVSHPRMKDILFRKLVAVWYGTSSMIRYLGYTEHDVIAAVESLKQEAESK